jgi:hypothetical protein
MPGNRYSLDATLKCYKYEQKTISSAAIPFTLANISDSVTKTDAVRVDIVLAATNGIRYTLDGSIPTAALGMPIAGGASFSIVGVDNIRAFLAIRSGGTDAVADMQFFR